MNKEWQLPPVYETDIYRSYLIAKSVIEDFAQNRYVTPSDLFNSVTEYLSSDLNDAKDALRVFITQLSGSNEDFDSSENPKIQAALTIGIVTTWASSETVNRYTAFRALTRSSSWVKNLWTEVAVIVAQDNRDFKEALLHLAEQYFVKAEKKLLEESQCDPLEPITLDEIWYGHTGETRIDDSSWQWIELLAKLDPGKLFKWMNSTKSLLLINRMLGSPEFCRNYDLWEKFTLQAPPSFESDGSWNDALLLPCLLRHGSTQIIYASNSYGYTPAVLESHVKSLLTYLVGTLAKRSDFEGIFKRWGTWLTLQHLRFPDKNQTVSSQDILWALAGKAQTSLSPAISAQLNISWEPWVYQSMLALLHSNYPDRFLKPDVSAFVKEWNLTPTEWNSLRGKSLRSHVSRYHISQPNDYACRVLGYSVALSDNFASHWLSMWNSSFALREILEFNPTQKTSKEWKPSDASWLMRTLADVGLGILDCTTNDKETADNDVLEQAATLFNALWEATTEMLSIDVYGDDFWPIMQQHLAIRRLRWTVEAMNADDNLYDTKLNKDALPTSQEVLALVSSTPRSLIELLPILVQNKIPKQALKELINQTEIDLISLASNAVRLQNGPARKFKIGSHHVKLIKELT